MKNILLFLCSGTSSRFNGKTKALAKISGSETVIEFNLKKVSEFDQVYIVANETNYSEFEKLNLENVKLIKIKTGNGDADSLLNALKELQKIEDFEKTRYEVQVMSFQGEKQDEENKKLYTSWRRYYLLVRKATTK